MLTNVPTGSFSSTNFFKCLLSDFINNRDYYDDMLRIAASRFFLCTLNKTNNNSPLLIYAVSSFYLPHITCVTYNPL